MRIAIVEDEKKEIALLQNYLQRFEKENSTHFTVTAFDNSLAFLSEYNKIYDVVFMDIEMPLLNGIDTAMRLREIDSTVALVFITNMEQLAVRGYEVNAVDFVVKPINYYRFSAMLKKTIRIIKKNLEKEIILTSSTKITRLRISQIYYVEVRDHLLIYHADIGNFENWGNLKDAEALLSEYNFARCNNGYLVNLHHVVAIDGNTVIVCEDKIPVSQRRRKDFYNSVTNYLGANK